MRMFLDNLVRIFVKHYAENRYSYLALMLGTFGLPLLMTLLKRDAVPAVSMMSGIYLFNVAYSLYISTRDMRQRYTFIMANTLPISTAQRYAFILINSTLFISILFAVCYFPSVAIAVWQYPVNPDFGWVLDTVGRNPQMYIGLIGAHGVLLLVNLTARRRVMLNYIVAMAVVLLSQWFIAKFIDIEMRQEFKMWANIIVAVVAWVSGYFILKRRQIQR